MPLTTVRNFNDGTTGNWGTPHQGNITYDAVTKQEGAGAIQIEKINIPAGYMQHRSGLQWPNTQSLPTGNVIGAWVRVSSVSAGPQANYMSRMWWQSNASPYNIYAPVTFENVPIDTWTYIEYDFAANPIEAIPGWVGVEIVNESFAGGTLRYHVDLFVKGTVEGGGGGEPPPPDPGTDTLTVQGNKLLHNGNPVLAQGVNHASVWSTGERIFHGRGYGSDMIAQLLDWETNIVRISMDQDRWLGETTFRDNLKTAISNYHAQGFIIIVSRMLGHSGDTHSDADSYVWSTNVATWLAGSTLKNIIIEPYNEPVGNTWADWKSKGQTHINNIRNAGSRHPILLNANNWGNDGSQFLSMLPTDPLGRLMCGWHTYDWTGDSWPTIKQIGLSVPVIIGEFNVHKDQRNSPGWISTFWNDLVTPMRASGTCIPVAWWWVNHDQYSDTGLFTQAADNGQYYEHPNIMNAVRDPNADLIRQHYRSTPTNVFSTTPSGSDTTPPTISSVVATPGLQSVAITWTTNEPGTTQVKWGTTNALGSQTTLKDQTVRVVSHSETIAGLSPNTTYYYRVESTDSSGNTGTNAVGQFTTLPLPTVSTINPTVVVAGATNQPIVIVGTNFRVGSKVYFGTTEIIDVTRIGSTQLNATIPTALMTTAGTYQIKVAAPEYNASTNPSVISNAATFTVNPSVPDATEVYITDAGMPEPPSVKGLTSTRWIYINTPTARFINGDVAYVNDQARQTEVLSPTQLRFLITSGDLNYTGNTRLALSITVRR
jgi:hypothetical protein